MKKLLIILLSGMLSLSLLAEEINSNAQNPAVQLTIVSPLKIFENGDKIEIAANGFTPAEEIMAVLVVVDNADGSFDLKVLDKGNLSIDFSGNLSGFVVFNKLDVTDITGRILLSTKKSIIYPTEKFSIKGDIPHFSTRKLLEAGTFTFSEASGDGIAQLGERFDIDTPNSGWAGTVLVGVRYEYGGGTLITPVSVNYDSISISSGQLEGFAINSNTPYTASTDSITLGFLDGSFLFGESSNGYTTIDNISPQIGAAWATSLTNIRIEFDEPVQQTGSNAYLNFNLSGSDTGTASPNSLSAVGTSPTSIWDLGLSGSLSNRGPSSLTVEYDTTGSTDSLQDQAGNEVEHLSSSSVADSIPPGVTTLRDSSDAVALTIGEFLGNTTYKLVAKVTGGNSDTSLDSVVFEGSDNGTAWTVIGSDDSPSADGSDSNFEWTWDVADPDSQFRMLRARAFDTNDNFTNSSSVGSATDGFNDNFKDTYRAVIEQVLPSSIGQSSGTQRAAIIVELQNNYGDSVNTTSTSNTFTVSETSTTTESWWSVSSGGSPSSTSINLTIVSTAGEDTVWYSNSAAGGPNTLALVEVGNDFALNNGDVTADGQTVTVTIAKIVNVDNWIPAVDSNIDSTVATGGDISSLQMDVDGPEDTGDDFRILWGFTNIANPTPAQISEIDTSVDLTPPVGGGTVSHTVPLDSLKNLSTTYYYMFYWLENVTTTADSTILDGFPIKTDPARLIFNPELITAAGDNGADVRGGPFAIGVDDQEIVSIKFTTDPTQATIKLNGLVFDFTQTSTVDENDLSEFHLYRDAGTIGVYDPALDVLLDDVTMGVGVTSVNFNAILPVLSVTGSGVHVLVTVDVLSGADPGHQLGLKISGPNSINLDPTAQVFNGPNSSLIIRTFSDIGTSQDYPLPVSLLSFSARSGYDEIILEWSTASEQSNAGFYLTRSSEADGEYTRLNSELIEGQGNSNTLSEYSYTDSEVQAEANYYYKLYSVDFNGTIHVYGSIASASANILPKEFALAPNYPNPFNPSTRISFDVAKESAISLEIYNMLGQKIRTLIDNQRYQPGVYSDVIWDAKDDQGNSVANGIYYLVYSAKDYGHRQVRKMVFMK